MTHIEKNSSNAKPRYSFWRRSLRFLIWFLVFWLVLITSIMGVLSSERGTQFILDEISQRTNIKIHYVSGDFLTRLSLSDVVVPATKDLTIKANKLDLQVGWYALFAGKAHLSFAHIDRLDIIDNKAPTGEPFDYMTIKTPLPVSVSDVSAKVVNFTQKTKDPVYLYDIAIKKANWRDTKVVFYGVGLDVSHQVLIQDAQGDIRLQDDYPLNLQSDVTILAISKVYFSTLNANLHGSLKQTFGTVSGKYNNYPFTGSLVAQGLSDDTPFDASLNFGHIVLPYASEQNITLTDGKITAKGTPDNIEIRILTELSAKDIPQGKYAGRGVITDGGMTISRLTAKTQGGTLIADGTMDWSGEYQLDANLYGQKVSINDILPLQYQEYKDYLPKTFSGSLGVKYFYLDTAKNQTRWQFNLAQKDGETVDVSLVQSQKKPNLPWQIDAKWQNLVRENLPDIGKLNSPSGAAAIVVGDGNTQLDVHADIKTLSVAPSGDYQTKMAIKNNQLIDISSFSYQGVLGDLSGKGQITLPKKASPLLWQVDLKTSKLKPNAYFDVPNKTPIKSLSGQLVAKGQVSQKNGQTTHQVTVNHSDLTAVLTDKPQDKIHLITQGGLMVRLKGDELLVFGVDLTGDVNQSLFSELPKSDFAIKAQGNLSNTQISKFTINNDNIKASLAGDIAFSQGVKWSIKAHLDEVDTAKFAQNNSNLIAKINGDLATTGSYYQDKLQNFSVKFDGQILNKSVASGNISLDMTGAGDRLQFNHLSHQSSAGQFLAKGFTNLNDLSWQFDAKMTNFDAGKFVKGLDSHLTGGFSTKGSWGGKIKSFEVKELDLSGDFRGQPVIAQGAISAKIDLPNDLNAYFRRLKSATAVPKNTNELLNLQKQVQINTYQTQRIFKMLNADHLTLKMGDSQLLVDGTDKNLSATLNIPDLSQLVFNTRGQIKGGIILVNDNYALPTIYVDLTANEVRTADLIVQKVSVLGKVVNLANLPSQLRVEVDNVIALGKVIKYANLNFVGTYQQHNLTFAAKNNDIETKAQIVGSFDERKGRYQGVMDAASVQSKFGKLAQIQPAEFSYAVKNNQIAVAAHCWQSSKAKGVQTGSLCLQNTLHYSNTSGDVALVVQNLDTSVISAILPSDILWQSTLNGKLAANWQAGKSPVVNAVIYSDNGKVGVSGNDTGYVEMPYQRVSIIAQTVPTGLKLRTDIQGVIGSGYADVIVDAYKPNKPIAGAVALNNINLAVIRPFLPSLQMLSGTVNLAGGVGGTLTKPLFYGNADLKNGQLAVAGVPVVLKDINADMAIRGTQASLMGGFIGGAGKGKLTGEMDWRGELQAKLAVTGENLTISNPPLVVASFSPDIEVIVRPSQKYVNVQGVVLVPSATIRPPSTSSEIIDKSADVSVIDRRLTGNVDKILAVSAPWSINANIGLDLGSDVAFQGFGAKLPLAGTLHLTQSGQDSMKAKGVIQLSERTVVDGIGQNIELKYAQVRFNGNMLNPRLSIEGEKEVEGATVGLRIKGTANNPDITVFNDAGLTEQQAMNALITGRIDESSDIQTSEQTFRSRVTNNLAAAGLSLGLSGTRNITNQIGNALGFESLTVDALGNSSDTNVTVTGYITPDLYLRYGVGVFNAESSLSMRYQLTRRVYIEAVMAVENMVNVIYQWRF